MAAVGLPRFCRVLTISIASLVLVSSLALVTTAVVPPTAPGGPALASPAPTRSMSATDPRPGGAASKPETISQAIPARPSPGAEHPLPHTDMSVGRPSDPRGPSASPCARIAADDRACSAGIAGVHADATATYGFQVASPARGIAPPPAQGAMLAWDPSLDAVVYFGGLDAAGNYLNATWEYFGGAWTNITSHSTNSPPARAWGAMTYDDGIGGIILTGGCNETVCPFGDTWEEYDGYWTNLTSTAGSLDVLGSGLYAPSMAANGTNGVVVFGGCWDSTCATMNSYTFFFSPYPGVCATSQPCWWYIPSMPGPPARDFAGFTAAGWGDDYLFGGFSPAGGTGGTLAFNDTWEFNPANMTWVDITAESGNYYGEYPNLAVYGDSLFFDPDFDVVFLYGGGNATIPGDTNQFFYYDGFGWYPASLAIPGGVQPPAWLRAFAPVASTPFANDPPVLFGGINSSLVTLSNDTEVFEPPLVTTANAAPLTVETNVTVNFYANVTGGSCDAFYAGYCAGNWTFGDGMYTIGENLSHVYTTAGSYAATFVGQDGYGVSVSSTVDLTVTSFTVAASANLTTVARGVSVAFAATPTGGTLPYNYTWHFTDGSVLYGSSVTHAFASAGLKWGNVTVRDATGTEIGGSAKVDVIAPLSGSASATPALGVDLGHSVTFTALGAGGVPPYNYTWTVPDGTGYGASYLYTPTAAGSLTVTVTIRDSASSSTTRSVTTTVNPALSISPSALPSAPTTRASVTFAAGLGGGTGPYTYSWSFGNGVTSTIAAPSTVYTNAGTFTVQLWVNDSGGGAAHQVLPVTVHASGGSPSGSSSGGIPLWVWAIVGVALVAAVVGVLLARRRKGPASTPAPAVPASPSGSAVPPPPGPPPGAM